MKKFKERSIWVWSCLKIRRRSVCGVKSLKPGKMKCCAAEKMPGRRFHLKTATDNSGSNISESAMWVCDRATVLSLQTWSRLCSWAPCSWALAVYQCFLRWTLITITPQASTLPSESHRHCHTAHCPICVSQATIFPSQAGHQWACQSGLDTVLFKCALMSVNWVWKKKVE